MSMVFEDVAEAESESEALKQGAQSIIDVLCQITAPKDQAVLTAKLELQIRDPYGHVIYSLQKDGSYHHFWTAVDDGAVHNALLDAFEKIIPEMLNSKTLRDFARDFPLILAEKKKEKETNLLKEKKFQQKELTLVHITLDKIFLTAAESASSYLSHISRGQKVNIVLEYTISETGPQEKIDLILSRKIFFGDIVLSETVSPHSLGSGTYQSSKRITFPQDADPGTYTLIGTITYKGKEVTKTVQFIIK